ncbi:nSTAND3 domain-containing NTPase [Chryseobacterium arthrosphaerae]|uniref:nSTAND3 domain-containing NTPase n=1 Tax=Chryseobacterium arthrosphaerae TaxID=651561 RepID=UPI001F4AC71D|nr:restriction endonuclease [Chryseobacterium arthrosphaerae]
MSNYDLNIFSPSEFEEFCRDILQAKLNVFIESFKTGKDGGIDLRYSTPQKKNIIIQAKRYKDFISLINNLKKEIPKVTSLDPESYIITTSIGLTPQNKDIIKKLFEPYIKSTEDIYGRDDLLNILDQNKKIEEKYYKLWITSTPILQKVLHSKIYNQSQFEIEEINEQAKLFVQNDSFPKALKILDEHRYIIISGIPGIGKTTLARILVQYLLSSGYEEFVYLSDKIDDGYTYFHEGRKQVFLFDDFLGRNFFDAKSLQKNDDKIVKFIKKIQSSPDKVLILATREYIFNQAKEIYEAFKINNIDVAKCIIDLSVYTKVIKAKILYNHLFNGEIPDEFLDNLIKDENYKSLITHPNYNPRIIETFIKQKIWTNCSPNDFFNTIKKFFDNPEFVWLSSFQTSLNKFSQYTLLVLATLGTPVLLVDLEIAVKNFFVKNTILGINYDPITFEKSIRELENTFIKTNFDKKGNMIVEYQNPSIYDFLVNYVNKKNTIISNLISSFVFIEQFQTIFSGNELIGRIKLNNDQIKAIGDKIIEIEEDLKTCKIYKSSNHNGDFEYVKNREYLYSFLNYLNNNYAKVSATVKEFIYRNFSVKFDYSTSDSEYLQLLNNLDLTKFEFDEEEIIDSFFCYTQTMDDLNEFEAFRLIFPETYQKWIASEHFSEIAYPIIDKELEDISGDDIFYYHPLLESIAARYPLDLREELEWIEKKMIDYDKLVDHQIEMANDREFDDYDNSDKISEDTIIMEIFNSLKE